MSKRFFAFGCSYTKYSFATWADYVGANFDEYYNYGRGGASNTYIMNKFVEANDNFNFTSDDLVIVMFTGFGRFSYSPNSNGQHFQWKTQGDLYENYAATKDPVIKSFVENMYCDDWAVYSSWIAVKTIKQILTANNIPHKFLMSMDNSNYLEEDGSKWGLENKITLTHLTRDIYDMLDDKESFDVWKTRENFNKWDYVHWVDENNRMDGHPTQKMHYEYVEKKLPEFITEKSRQYFMKAEQMFKPTTQHAQGSNFSNELQCQYDKSYQNGLL